MAMAENREPEFFDLIMWRNPVLRDGDGKRVYKVIGPDLQVRGSFYACSHSPLRGERVVAAGDRVRGLSEFRVSN